MIDSNIPYLLGAGSGIDSKSLVEQLVSVEKSVRQEQIDTKRAGFETKISDYGLFKSALSTLQQSLATLKNPDTFTAKSVSFSDSDAVIPTAIEAGASSGTYSIEVTNIAKAQTLAATSFADVTSEVGKGTLTFSFGAWDTAVPPTTFTPDASTSSVTITIDDSNNSLTGLRDAINAANFGVNASIVNTGSGYQLMLKAESGLNNQLSIEAVEEGATPTNNDADGLSRFSFNETAQQMSQQQAGKDANLILNGLAVTRETNDIKDLIEGFSFTIAKDAPGEVANITISDDKLTAEDAIRNFVEVYNEFLETSANLAGFNEETQEFGSLARDALVKSMIAKVHQTITNPVAGGVGVLNALTNLGIRTERDGSMSIDETAFKRSFNEQFSAIAELFTPKFSSTADKIKVTGYGTDSVPGNYEVVISQAPEKGFYTGAAIAGFPIDTTGKDYSFKIQVNGTTGASLSLPDGEVYSTQEELVTALQLAINNDTTLGNNKVTVSFDTDHLVFTSNAFGSASVINFMAAGADAADLGFAVGSGTSGKDVKGTVDGIEAFGLADVLLPAFGSDAYGLKLKVLPGATDATVNFSRGIAGGLDKIVTQFLGNDGPIKTRENGLNKEIAELDEDQEKLDRRIEAYQARLQAQFIAMEAIVDQLNSTRDYLGSALENLPFTARRD